MSRVIRAVIKELTEKSPMKWSGICTRAKGTAVNKAATTRP